MKATEKLKTYKKKQRKNKIHENGQDFETVFLRLHPTWKSMNPL